MEDKRRNNTLKKLLKLDKNDRWNLEGIEFAIKERVGKPEYFIGRIKEIEFLYKWADNIQHEISRSIAFLGRRKIGKSLILERLYNIIYSEQKGLIPFYYEFTEGTRSGKKFYHDFLTRFYMQVVGYYLRDTILIRNAINIKADVDVSTFRKKVESISLPNKEIIVDDLNRCINMLKREEDPYEYVIAATATPRSFATTPGVEEKVVQMIDEFQYLNMYIDAGVEDKPCKAYMSTAEMKVSPLIITGSLVGVVSEELMRWLPHRFDEFIVPKMDAQEAINMTMNYGNIYGHSITPEISSYIVHITNNVPGRIIDMLSPKFGKPLITSAADADKSLKYEVEVGTIKHDWDEYLMLAMKAVNDINMRRITWFLCRHEGEWFYPMDLKREMSLDIDDQKLRDELGLLYKYDIVEKNQGRYGGVFDRTLKKVFMTNYRDILGLPDEDFDEYFRNDSLLDYLKERIRQLELGLEDADILRNKLKKLQGDHNNLKGHYYERVVLLELIKSIINKNGVLTEGISVTDFSYTLCSFLESGHEIDIVLEGENVVIMAECKNYAPEYIHKITKKMVEEFAEKARRLAKERFQHKKLRLAYFSKNGVEEKMKPVFDYHGIVLGN
jgi:hypothetical protein